MGKSTTHAAHDGDDDELQRFSKGVATLFLEMRDGAMGGNMGSTSATKSVAVAVPLGVRSQYSSTHLILAVIARTSESVNAESGRDVHHGSTRALVGQSAGYSAVYTTHPQGERISEDSVKAMFTKSTFYELG
jgi:hypothetical protein